MQKTKSRVEIHRSKSRRYLIYHAAKNDILLTKSSIMNDIYSNLWHISYAMNSLTIVLYSLNFSDELPRSQDKGVRILKQNAVILYPIFIHTPWEMYGVLEIFNLF